MKFMYEGPNRLREGINGWAACALILYVLSGNFYNLVNKTGHPSADIATGRSQPTPIERVIMEGFSGYGNALLNADEIYSPMPLVK